MTSDEFIKGQKKYELTDGTVDRLYKYLSETLSEIKLDFESLAQECQFTKLLKDIPYIYNATYPKVEERLKELLKMHNIICGKKYYDEKEGTCIDDSTWRFDRFYSYCENELMGICPDRKTLLDYLTHLFYANGNFYNCDKAILWNAFGEDICNRYIKREINMSPADLAKLAKKEKKARIKAAQIKEMCSNANLVHIKDLPGNEIYITDTDVNYIVETIPDDQEAQRRMIALLVLYRKINSEHGKGKKKAIKIKKGKKNEVTIYQICKLADIYNNQVCNRLELLYKKKLIGVDLQNLKVAKITVYIPEHEKTSEEHKIVDINDIRKVNIFEDKMA